MVVVVASNFFFPSSNFDKLQLAKYPGDGYIEIGTRNPAGFEKR
jgi:hypothetical protein